MMGHFKLIKIKVERKIFLPLFFCNNMLNLYRGGNNMKFMITKELTTEIKGIAILMVIIGHISSVYGESVLNYIGSFGVALFLFISGYGLAMSYNKNGLKDFFKKRFINIFIPYVAITTIWIIVDLIKGVVYPFKTYVLLLIGFDYNRTIDATMWYISFIILWYIVFYLVFKNVNKNFFKVIILFMISFIFFIFKKSDIMIDFSWQWSLHAFTFSIGVASALYLKNMMDLRRILVLNITSLIFIVFLLNKIHESTYIQMSMNILITAFVITLEIIKSNKIKHSKGLCLAGKYSYELYLLEGYLTRIFSLDNRIIALIIYIITLILLSYIIKKVFNIFFRKTIIKKQDIEIIPL